MNEPLHSPAVDQGQDGAVQMEKLRAERAGQRLSVPKQICCSVPEIFPQELGTREPEPGLLSQGQ